MNKPLFNSRLLAMSVVLSFSLVVASCSSSSEPPVGESGQDGSTGISGSANSFRLVRVDRDDNGDGSAERRTELDYDEQGFVTDAFTDNDVDGFFDSVSR